MVQISFCGQTAKTSNLSSTKSLTRFTVAAFGRALELAIFFSLISPPGGFTNAF